MLRENVKDIIACGFDIKKTFIFSDVKFIGGLFVSAISVLLIILKAVSMKMCSRFRSWFHCTQQRRSSASQTPTTSVRSVL
jgi:tryptophanyl-tRNA synthetase